MNRAPTYLSLVSTLASALLLAACADGVGPEDDPPEECRLTPVAFYDVPAQQGDVRDVHDPMIARHGDRYYLFSTGHGVPVRWSDDLVRWNFAGQVFAGSLPPWAPVAVSGAEFPWAPDVAFFGGRYHLYYSISTFGRNRSAIGLATNPTLDASDPGYAWTDHGAVVESVPNRDDFNAIDPNVVVDADGVPWLAWGSFWGGIKMRRLDPATGLLSDADATLYALAARPVETAVEAPFIVRRGDYYYLFVSFDACCQGASSTYRIMVGRAPAVTGPYVDRSGRDLREGGGTLVLKGYGRIAGPGHNAVLADDGRTYLVHHFYDALDGGVPKLQVRLLAWDADGWPLPGAPYDRPAPPAGTPGVTGRWGHSKNFTTPYAVTFAADGTIERCDADGTWTQTGTSLTLRWPGADGSGEQVDRCTVADDGDSYVCRSDAGEIVQGHRLAE